MNYTGENIKEICKKFHLTQEQFGELIGIKKRTVQSYIGGRAIPEPLQKLIAHVIEDLTKAKERERLVNDLTAMRNSLNGFIDDKTMNTLDALSKETIIAYILNNEAEFSENGLYQAFLESKLSDAKLKWETQRLLSKGE